jgi:hypothetical protein
VRVETSFSCDLPLNGGYISGFAPGYDNNLYVLVCMGEKDDNWIERRSPCDWRILSVGHGQCDEFSLRGDRRNFTFVQPLPDGFLLATGRCKFSDIGVLPNGCRFDLNGQHNGTVLLGDGIQHLQTTSSGRIWAAYFDEGIIGNLGWRHPIGSSGLVCFEGKGDRIFQFEPASGLDDMVDCYALNVVSNTEVWCYYYTQFPIVKIQNDRVVAHWSCPVRGASTFAVWQDSVLMQGGYNSQEWKLLELLSDGRTRTKKTYEFYAAGHQLGPATSRARGRHLWFLDGASAYRTDLSDLRA